MQLFQCRHCSALVFFENTRCEACGQAQGYLSGQNRMTTLQAESGGYRAREPTGAVFQYCANHSHDVCNWLVPAQEKESRCIACALNETIPNLDSPGHRLKWQKIEIAKHRLVYSLVRMGLPVESKTEAPESGLAFAFLADDGAAQDGPEITTGHAQGKITINIAEADPAHREAAREQMGEPYRTLIGHFRHEIGHYYWERLIGGDAQQCQAFRSVFGDERDDYAASLQNYYSQTPPPNWQQRYVSAYCTSHPWEDWAETWAHYFHIIDTLETAYAFGVRLDPPLENHPELRMQASVDPYRCSDFDTILSASMPLTLAVNSLNRSMGLPDLYPFVLPPAVLDKLRFIHRMIHEIHAS